MRRLAELREDPRIHRLRESRLGRLVVALAQGNLRDRALTLAGQAFIALVPLLIVVATMASSGSSDSMAAWLIDRFDLRGDSADAVRQLFARPPGGTDSVSVIGILLLLVSLASFARSMQRTYELAWDLGSRAPGRGLSGLAGTLALLAALLTTVWVAGKVHDVPGERLTITAIQFAVGIPAWWLAGWLLLSRRVGWLVLLPGAAVSSLGQALTSWAGSIWIPHLVHSNTQQYGVIGVAMAIVSWLVVLALLIVASAVAGAEFGSWLAGRHPRGPARTASGPPQGVSRSSPAAGRPAPPPSR